MSNSTEPTKNDTEINDLTDKAVRLKRVRRKWWMRLIPNSKYYHWGDFKLLRITKSLYLAKDTKALERKK